MLIDAKRDVEKEIEALRALKEQYSHSGNTTKSTDEGEIDDTENAQDSVSEDDSDDDSDRKGTFKHISYYLHTCTYLHIVSFIATYVTMKHSRAGISNGSCKIILLLYYVIFTEEDEEEAAMGRELEALTSDIDVKQRLIQELELSQRRLQTMKQHYEDKLSQLQARIKDTQEERDKVLLSLQQQPTPPPEKVKKLRDEYEKKLANMQKEMRLLQSAKKEHARLLKNQSQNENRLRGLRNELSEMKRAKVKLLNKMREEAQRHKENELRRNREIAQLRKESRRHANVIRTLEADKRMKEVVLRRKQEEVTALRKRDKGLSQKAAGRAPVKSLNPKALKQRWQTFERTIAKQALAKQAAAETEREMERLLQEREELGRDLERLQKHRSQITSARGDTADIDEEIDNVESKISYLQVILTV